VFALAIIVLLSLFLLLAAGIDVWLLRVASRSGSWGTWVVCAIGFLAVTTSGAFAWLFLRLAVAVWHCPPDAECI